MPATHPTEDIEDVPGEPEVLVALAVHRKLNHVHENQAEADELHHDADGEEAGHRMPLPPHRVYLQGDEHGVDEDEDEVHLERVLLVVGELERQRDKGRLIGIAIDQPEVVDNVRNARQIETARIEVVPLARRCVAVAGHEGHVPESASEGKEIGIRRENYREKIVSGIIWGG